MFDPTQKGIIKEMIIKLVESEIGDIDNFNSLTTKTSQIIGTDDNFKSLKKYLEMIKS